MSAVTAYTETLDDLLREAEAQNPAILAAQKLWEAAKERIITAGSLSDPKLSYSYYLEEIQTKTGPQNQKVGISQTFPLTGKRGLRREAAGYRAEALASRARATRATILFNLKKTWFELYYLTSALETEQARLHLFHISEKTEERAIENGSNARGLLDIRIILAQINDQICTLEIHKAPLQTTLNALLNRDLEGPLPAPASLPIHKEIHETDLRSTFHINNPAIEEQSQNLARHQTESALADRNWIPDITLGADWIETGDGGEDPLIGTISINLPIWHTKNRAERLTAELDQAAQQKNLQDEINTAQVRLTNQLTKRHHAIHRIALHEHDLIPSAQQHVELTRTAYENGEVNLRELTASEDRLLKLLLMLERKRTNRAIAEAHIEKLLGGPNIPAIQIKPDLTNETL